MSRPVRAAVRASITAAVVTLVVGLAVPQVVAEHQLLILVVGFALGLPHGAVDHLVPFWSGLVDRRLPHLLLILTGYVAVAAISWAGLKLAGFVMMPLLLLLSAVHFGSGDQAAELQESNSRALRVSTFESAITTLARGGVVIAGPLLVWPAQTGRAFAALDASTDLPPLWIRYTLAAVIGVCVLSSAVTALRRRNPRAAVECLLLSGLFTIVPPLAAFGVYFGMWHGLRHTARLIATDPRNRVDLCGSQLLRPIGRFLRSAVIPTLVAGGATAALIATAQAHGQLAGSLFEVLFALTVPHLVIVAILDHSHPLQHPNG